MASKCPPCQSLFQSSQIQRCLYYKENWNQDAKDGYELEESSKGSVKDCSTVLVGSSKTNCSSVAEEVSPSQTDLYSWLEPQKRVLKDLGNENIKERFAAKKVQSNCWRELQNPAYAADVLRLIFTLLLGMTLVIGICFLVLAFWEDLNKKREQENNLKWLEVQQCLKDYLANDCDPTLRKPALKAYCSSKERCFNQDHELIVKSSRLTASLIAEILNDFVKPLEVKTMCFLVFLTLGIIFTFNSSLGGYPESDHRRNRILEEINSKLDRIEKKSAMHPSLMSLENNDFGRREISSS